MFIKPLSSLGDTWCPHCNISVEIVLWCKWGLLGSSGQCWGQLQRWLSGSQNTVCFCLAQYAWFWDCCMVPPCWLMIFWYLLYRGQGSSLEGLAAISTPWERSWSRNHAFDRQNPFFLTVTYMPFILAMTIRPDLGATCMLLGAWPAEWAQCAHTLTYMPIRSVMNYHRGAFIYVRMGLTNMCTCAYTYHTPGLCR